jgi:hypothetical protein
MTENDQKIGSKIYMSISGGGGVMNRVYIYANIICDTAEKKHDVIKS